MIGVIGVAASVAPGLGHGDSAPAFADDPKPTKPVPEPAAPEPDNRPDAALGIAAVNIPGQFAAMLPAGELGAVLTDDPYPLVNTKDERIVHFLWDGTLTTFIIEPASGLGSCEEFAAQGDGVCQVVGGLETLTWGPTTADEVTSQGVEVWQHGYVVSALSYNAPDGKDVAPVVDAPPVSLEQLTQLVRSEVWFS